MPRSPHTTTAELRPRTLVLAAALILLFLGIGVLFAVPELMCRRAHACTTHGQCTYSLAEKRCFARHAADCRTSDNCKTTGMCGLVGNVCGATVEDDCQQSSGCRTDGRCTKQGNRCTPSDAICRARPKCADEGKCSAGQRSCIAAEDADCAESTLCKDLSWCSARYGRCVAAKSTD